MPVRFLTGRSSTLAARLTDEIGRALTESDAPVWVLVPQQLTLETELKLLSDLNIAGSFQLQVFSPARFCMTIFEETGAPAGARIDERGRVMLLSAIVDEIQSSLTWYRDAGKHRGFEMRLSKQLSLFKQYGVTPSVLKKLAETKQEHEGRAKLTDLCALYAAYEAAIQGRFQDGEDEINEAIMRIKSSALARRACLWVFGFDLMPPITHRLIAEAASVCARTAILLPLENDEHARDFSVYLPLQNSYERLFKRLREAGVDWTREPLAENTPDGSAIRHLARELFCIPARPYEGVARNIQFAALKNPLDEAMFAAALSRMLVMRRGFRYSDIQILARHMDAYEDALTHAFQLYGVPVFLAQSRPADRLPLSKFLLSTLAIIAGDDNSGDALRGALATGYMDATDEECDRFSNYITQFALRSRAFLKPLKRGDPETLADMEALRARMAKPMETLLRRLKDADVLTGQLTAIYEYLTDANAYEKGEAMRAKLIQMNCRDLAAEDAQAWNRIIGTLDQMHALMGDERISLKRLRDVISRALAASDVKPLPQSGDAVSAIDISRVSALPVKAMIVIGLSGEDAPEPTGLLTPLETKRLSQESKLWLGPDALENARTERMYIKNALGLVSDYICFTYPISASDDSALRPSPVIGMLNELFPNLPFRGGIDADGDPAILRMRRAAPEAAATYLAQELSEAARRGEIPDSAIRTASALSRVPAMRARLTTLKDALASKTSSEALDPQLARRVYGKLGKISVTRLERFAKCPFAHFARYGLSPEIIEPFGLNARGEGGFYHEAVRAFMSNTRASIRDLSPDQAETVMDAVCDPFIDQFLILSIGESALNRAQAEGLRKTARRAARTLNQQLGGSKFSPIALEVSFGEDDTQLTLIPGDSPYLAGRIDRVDAWEDAGERYLRVIDYKRGNTALSEEDMDLGLQLQLVLYLAAAVKAYGGKPAGAFYFRIDDPAIATQSMSPEEIEKERLNRLRMTGLFPEDPNLLRAMAPEPDKVFKLRILADGSPYKGTFTADHTRFQTLMDRAMEISADILKAILRGDTRISPAKTQTTDACAYCEYAQICMKDRLIPTDKPKRAGE